MTVLDPFILPSDVVVAPLAQLAPELRELLGADGDFAITRPRSRASSRVVDAGTARLLTLFRAPTTIVDAVIAYSRAGGLDPRATLEAAVGVLGGFVSDGLLVPPDSDLATPIATTLHPGDHVRGFEVLEPVQLLVDTEVHLARGRDGGLVALKIARLDGDQRLRVALAHEAMVLARLDGRVSPLLLACGEFDGRAFLATAWCRGVDGAVAAADARELGSPRPPRAREVGGAAFRPLLELAERILAAYAHLHAQSALHGDVHPRNLLVDAGGGVMIIDFERAQVGDASPAGRGGVDFYVEPELAATRLAGERAATLTAGGEQYALGALLYLVLTGAHTHAFSLERQQMQRQVLEEPALPFHQHGVNLPAVERTIVRALAKDRRARHSSVAAFLRAFQAAAASDCRRAPAAARDRRPAVLAPREPARRLLATVLRRLEVPGDLYAGGLPAPSASTMNGAAGIAYALLRIAEIRDDERLLATADLWATRAVTEARSPRGFEDRERGMTPETLGTNSFYHHAAGVHCVEALIARRRADDTAQERAVAAFAATVARPCTHLDVAFGQAGLLLGCSLALEALPAMLDPAALRAAGDKLRDHLWSELERQPALAASTELRTLGAAHGWAGYLFALLRWSDVSATDAPAGIADRLDQLAALATPAGRGLRWTHEAGTLSPGGGLAASWCNGAAGYVALWTLAHTRLREDRWARLAEQAAWTTAECAVLAACDLCCGLAGRAYALLTLHRHSGDEAWLVRARRLADLAATSVRDDALRRDSLYKGELGVALLAAELEAPESARMPLFEAEGWPARARGRASEPGSVCPEFGGGAWLT